MSENISKKISIISIAFLVIIGMFLYGFKVAKSKIEPYQTIDAIQEAVHSLVKFGAIIQTNRVIDAPEYVSREEFKMYEPSKVQPGYYALMGYDGAQDKYMAWLINEKGERLHSWEINYAKLDPTEQDRFVSPHAFKILKDGSLMVGFDSGHVMARIDQCSNPIWIKPGLFHHSIERAGDGSYWVWRGDNTAYGHYHYLTNFDSETGKTIREIGLVEDVIQSNYDNAIKFGMREDFPFQRFDKSPDDKDRYDIFHPNDIDILQPEMADQFPDFNAGDLLISLRNTHLVAVVDPNTKKVKWSANGPWRFQHDPDFTADGHISVFDNNSGFERSEILQINPTTYQVTNKLKSGNLYFYSETQGKHQYLPNGNLLLVMPDEGRAAEVTANGDKVFEINNISRFSDQYNEHLANGLWLPSDYFDSTPNCSTN